MKKALEMTITAKGKLRLSCGKHCLVISGRADLERIGNQCLDLMRSLQEFELEGEMCVIPTRPLGIDGPVFLRIVKP